jgi:folate-binding protein YgfZ
MVAAEATRIEAEYEAARQGAIWVAQNAEGRIRAEGTSTLDLLHRMSTNDLTGMAVGEARPTVLTTAIARTVDLIWVLSYADHALLLTGPGQGETVRRWLSRYIFFQDDVRLTDAGQEFGQFGVFGPKAAEAAEAVLPSAGSLEKGRFIEAEGVTVLRARPLAGDGFMVVGPADQMEALHARAEAGGALAASEATYQVLRIEEGQPQAGAELTEGYVPLEANLWSAVSFTKGCYIGQEIIARMESRGKLAKMLVGLKLGAPVEPGAEVRRDGAVVGVVSSAGVSPQAGPIALAFVKSAYCAAGGHVEVNGAKGEIAPFPIR